MNMQTEILNALAKSVAAPSWNMYDARSSWFNLNAIIAIVVFTIHCIIASLLRCGFGICPGQCATLAVSINGAVVTFVTALSHNLRCVTQSALLEPARLKVC